MSGRRARGRTAIGQDRLTPAAHWWSCSIKARAGQVSRAEAELLSLPYKTLLLQLLFSGLFRVDYFSLSLTRLLHTLACTFRNDILRFSVSNKR